MKTARNLLLFFMLTIAHSAFAQGSYFKILERPYTSLFQRIAQFPDGSVLVTDRLSEGPTLTAKPGFYMAKFDPCGALVWSKYYNPAGDKLLVDNILIGEDGSIFVMGTELNGSIETLFLMKLDGQGEVMKYRHYIGPWNEIFTYSLGLKNGRLMASGLLFFPGSQNEGAVFLFNEELEPIWAKQFNPVSGYGESILTNDGGALGGWGNQLVKLDAQGQLEWSVRVGTNNFPSFSVPVEMEEGFLFENNSAGESYLFLIRHDGTLAWQSDKFAARGSVDPLTVLPDGDALLIYNDPLDIGSLPAQLRVSPAGEIFQQKRLEIDYPLHANFFYHTLSSDNIVHLFGQVEVDYTQEAYHFDFLTRFPLDSPMDVCMFWENFENTVPNNDDLPIEIVNVFSENADLEIVERSIFSPAQMDVFQSDICSLASINKFIQIDTILACGQNWSVTLPHPDLVWEDGSIENPRQLDQPGQYTASMVDCRDTTTFEFSLEKTGCECNVFLPNAISPNGDGLNDELRPYSNCTLVEMQMDIYNRWGGRVFRSEEPGIFWDGNFNGEKVQAGTYLVMLRYQMVDELGVVRNGFEVQDLTLLK